MTDVDLPRIPLAQLPTPLEPAPRLSAAWGGAPIWIKRDDLTGFGLSGNKVRKLEYHLGAAQEAGATALVTCGAVQSNHCRATALVAARLGLGCVLYLRSRDGQPPEAVAGNYLLQRLAGADPRFITPAQWDDRRSLMAEAAAEIAATGGRAHVIPEGASDALGVAAFVDALAEIDRQIVTIPGEGPVTLWHASSSGGTTAGMARGATSAQTDLRVVGSSVGDTAERMIQKVGILLAETDTADAPFEIIDDHVGRGYGRTTLEELTSQVEATGVTGLIWDPTYTGKALHGLRREIEGGRFGPEDRVVFWHTGGGFAAFAHDFGPVL